jgi:hypothetical protein
MPILLPNGRTVGLFEPVHLKLPIGFATADAATLFKTPADVKLALERLWFEVTTAFAGGASSAIGVSSDTAPHSTKGDLLGGAAGALEAALTAGHKGTTIGTDFGSNGVCVLVPGATLRFDRIVSAYTSGAGFVHVLARQIS